MMKVIKRGSFLIICIIFLGIINSYVYDSDLKHQGQVVAYRGGGSEVDYNQLKKTGCTAKSIKDSKVNIIENTLEAVALSVNAGADIIHLNVYRTADDQLVVFHDNTLGCATDGTGKFHKTPYKKIKEIDAGYGYTFDNGDTFPFRGKGFKISKLEQFYQQYPNLEFWLNIKNNGKRSSEALYSFLKKYRSNTVIITSSKGIKWFKNKGSSTKLISVDSVKKCGLHYLLVGWAGIVPNACKDTIVLIPPSKAKYFWGYPERLAARLQEHGSQVYLWYQHESIDITQSEVIASGVGIVTGNTSFIRAAKIRKNTK